MLVDCRRGGAEGAHRRPRQRLQRDRPRRQDELGRRLPADAPQRRRHRSCADAQRRSSSSPTVFQRPTGSTPRRRLPLSSPTRSTPVCRLVRPSNLSQVSWNRAERVVRDRGKVDVIGIFVGVLPTNTVTHQPPPRTRTGRLRAPATTSYTPSADRSCTNAAITPVGSETTTSSTNAARTPGRKSETTSTFDERGFSLHLRAKQQRRLRTTAPAPTCSTQKWNGSSWQSQISNATTYFTNDDTAQLVPRRRVTAIRTTVTAVGSAKATLGPHHRTRLDPGFVRRHQLDCRWLGRFPNHRQRVAERRAGQQPLRPSTTAATPRPIRRTDGAPPRSTTTPFDQWETSTPSCVPTPETSTTRRPMVAHNSVRHCDGWTDVHGDAVQQQQHDRRCDRRLAERCPPTQPLRHLDVDDASHLRHAGNNSTADDSDGWRTRQTAAEHAPGPTVTQTQYNASNTTADASRWLAGHQRLLIAVRQLGEHDTGHLRDSQQQHEHRARRRLAHHRRRTPTHVDRRHPDAVQRQQHHDRRDRRMAHVKSYTPPVTIRPDDQADLGHRPARQRGRR